MESLSSSPGHLSLRHQCGVCGGVFELNDRFVARELLENHGQAKRLKLVAPPVLGNNDSTAYATHTRSCLFPDYGLSGLFVDDWFVCRKPGCPQCIASPEAATIHVECFELFRQTYKSHDTLDRLWRVAAWRVPWRCAPPVVLPETDIPRSGFSMVAEKYCMPRLSRIPIEIVALIRKHSTTSLFWRLASALQLADDLSKVAANDLVSMPFCKIGRWERGSPPVTSSHQLPFVSLTIDSRGIRQVQRFRDKVQYSQERYDHLVFVVQDAASFVDVVARFKVPTMLLLDE